MNLFFIFINTNSMKKILFLMLFFISFKVYAIDNIEIDGNNLIPVFSSDIKVYNYYTDKDNVNISVNNSSSMYELKEGKNEIIIDDYILNVFKNYKKESGEVYLTKLIVDGYNINFDRDIHEYDLTIDKEDHLDIKYELSNDEAYVSIVGNGNFNKNKNIIVINVNNQEEYKINVYKTISVSSVKEEKVIELSGIKKEIVIVLIVTISCILVFLFYYSLFINKTTLHI